MKKCMLRQGGNANKSLVIQGPISTPFKVHNNKSHYTGSCSILHPTLAVNSCETYATGSAGKTGESVVAHIGPMENSLTTYQANSIVESIRLFKAEILAQDWRLSEQRIIALEPALDRLIEELNGRPDAVSVVVMAKNVLGYIKRHGKLDSYDCLGFFKEALAQAVNLYESEPSDYENDPKIFKAAYRRFQELKKKLQISQGDNVLQTSMDDPGQETASGFSEAEYIDEDCSEMKQVIAALSDDVQKLIQKVEEQELLLARLEEIIDKRHAE